MADGAPVMGGAKTCNRPYPLRLSAKVNDFVLECSHPIVGRYFYVEDVFAREGSLQRVGPIKPQKRKKDAPPFLTPNTNLFCYSQPGCPEGFFYVIDAVRNYPEMHG